MHHMHRRYYLNSLFHILQLIGMNMARKCNETLIDSFKHMVKVLYSVSLEEQRVERIQRSRTDQSNKCSCPNFLFAVSDNFFCVDPVMHF